MEEVIQILMARDGISRKEATAQVKEVREMMLKALDSGDTESLEDIFMNELGLEPDFIPDFI